MPFKTIDEVRQAGFIGLQTIASLRATRLSVVPARPGVYLLVYPTPSLPPLFLPSSCGGHFKGRDPTVPPAVLQRKWVPSAPIVYVGKAGGGVGRAHLKGRLTAYLDFGAGKPVGHWGGRYVWHLADAESLLVCWKETGDADPATVERQLIDQFRRAFGCLPFANCRR